MANNITSNLEKSLQDLYLSKKYQEGIDYIVKNKSLFDDGSYHYNLGTFLMKAGRLGEARYHYEYALQTGNNHTSLTNNLDVLKKQIDGFELTDSSSYSEIFSAEMAAMGLNGYATISLVLVIISCLLLRKMQKKLLAATTVLLIALVPFVAYFSYYTNFTTAIALKETVLREGPSEIFPEMKKIKPGEKVIFLQSEGSYSFVRYPYEYAGWINTKDLGALP